MYSEAESLLGLDGPLAKKIPGFAPREQQQLMSGAVAEALDSGQVLIIEAGTGTGKTYAYLVPALLAGGRVIISTGTKHLQDQLFHRDLPMVRDALGLSVRVALLKGRANYVCLHRLEVATAEAGGHARNLQVQFRQIRSWASSTVRGDIAEMRDIPEDSPVWPRVTSTAENCLGSECDYFNECFVVKARRSAQDAEVLIINHHLLFADLALKEEGFGEVLPGADAFILDEAHQVPEVAATFFGQHLSSRQLLELARDAELEYLKEAGDMRAMDDSARALTKAVQDLRLSFGETATRGSWLGIRENKDVQAALVETQRSLQQLRDWLESVADRGRGLDSCWRRASGCMERLSQMTEGLPENSVAWYETFKRSFVLHLTPLEISRIFKEHMGSLASSWIFTSATLAVGESFDHFSRQLGLDQAVTAQLGSPFDFRNNGLLYLPQNMPDPGARDYNRAVLDTAREVLHASEGRAFLLFTSHRALQEAAEMLRGQLAYPLLVQGDMPRSELLKQFRKLSNAVLLGTSSFWEGVDVRGDALSCVLIDKLPFASPGDPVLQARMEAIRRQGGNPFAAYQLPTAVITLKQGVGRLIRDVSDRGVLVLCDPRLRSKSYGKVFLNSLPPMPRSDSMDAVSDFFAALKASQRDAALVESL